MSLDQGYVSLIFFIAILMFHSQSDAGIKFLERAREAGVADTGEANGAAFGDYDEDGWPDLVVTRLGEGEGALLYRNQGDNRFIDMNSLWDGPLGALGAVFADVNQDGLLDIYLVLHNASNELHRQQSGLFHLNDSFSIPGPSASLAMSAVFGDFDRDRRLDLFSTHRTTIPNRLIEKVYTDDFADQSFVQSGMRCGYDSFSSTPFDFNGDGWTDLFVSNFGWPSLLHVNRGWGTFRQISHTLDLPTQAATIAALPADFDNDGDYDLYVLNGAGEPNRLFENTNTRLIDVTNDMNVGGRASTLGGAWLDIDNDGYLDLITSNVGVPPDIFHNSASQGFTTVSTQAIDPASRDRVRTMAGVAASDVDRDGDVDVFLGGILGADALLVNSTDDIGNWIAIHLESRKDMTPIGASIQITTASGMQTRTITAATLMGTQLGNNAHFGLSGDVSVQSTRIQWPSGQEQVFSDILPNQRLEISEPTPDHDLSVYVLPVHESQKTWRQVYPVAQIVNRGTNTSTPREMLVQTRFGDNVVSDHSFSVPSIEAGDTVNVVLPLRTPILSGECELELTLNPDDDVRRNDVWRSSHFFHQFQDVADAVGVADNGNGWAAAFSDYDNDGDVDLYVSNGGSFGDGPNRLFRNEHGNDFSDVTLISGSADEGNGTGVLFADFDRDGYQDLYIAKGGFNPPGQQDRLLRNNRDGTFLDISLESGLDAVRGSYSVTAADYNQDGLLDLYISSAVGQSNTLYRNDHNGVFEDVSRIRHILSSREWSGAGAAFADYDNDGDVDLYAGVFGAADIFYQENGIPEYTSILLGNRGDTIGLAIGDYDADADLDIYTVNITPRSALYRNDIDMLTDVGSQSGTENLGVGTGAAFSDFDSDGDLDLFVSNAHMANRVYVNIEGSIFRDEALALGMADTVRSRAFLMADFDNDGDQDVYLVNEGAANRLYQNGGSQYRWLNVAVRGTDSNIDGIGARINLYSEGSVQIREVNGTAGLAHSSRLQHFGIGDGGVDSIRVRWPSGRSDIHKELSPNTSVLFVEGQSITAVEASLDVSNMTFSLSQNFPNPFNSVTTIPFRVDRAGRVRLTLYNALGQRICRLFDLFVDRPGSFDVKWNGVTDIGQPATSGVYFARLTIESEDESSFVAEQTRSLLLLR